MITYIIIAITVISSCTGFQQRGINVIFMFNAYAIDKSANNIIVLFLQD
jgi:hypothetical protein